eukprot:2864099-Amphidinium_carterae.1
MSFKMPDSVLVLAPASAWQSNVVTHMPPKHLAICSGFYLTKGVGIQRCLLRLLADSWLARMGCADPRITSVKTALATGVKHFQTILLRRQERSPGGRGVA